MLKSLPARIRRAFAAATISFVTVLSAGGAAATRDSSQGQAAVSKKIQALAGDWGGSFQWSGARTDAGKMQATYYATAGGTAIIENLLVDRQPIMTSVYHMDGRTLRMTHYCMAGNQPRLKAASVDEGAGTLRFELVDATNLAGPKAPHVQQVEIQFVDEDRIILTFGFGAAGVLSNERIDLLRTHQTLDKS